MKIDYKDSLYHEKRHTDLLKSRELREAWSHFAKLVYFQNITESTKILEYGAGLGNNLLALPNRANVYAYEPSIFGTEIAKKDGIKSYSNLDEIGNLKFDQILCRHVLEHVDHPKKVLEELLRLLAPHGMLTLVLPVDPLSQQPKSNDINNHLYCWNPRTIHNLLKSCGYADIKYRYEYFGARKKLLPIFRKFGGEKYGKAVRLVGRIFNYRELVIEARKNSIYYPNRIQST